MIKHLKSGFTLVEMLITMGIVSTLFIIFAQLAGGIFSLQLESGSYATLTQDYRYLLSRLAYDVSRATTLTVVDSSTLDLTINSSVSRYHWDGSDLTINDVPLNSSSTSLPTLSFSANQVLGGLSSVTVDATLTTTYSLPNQSQVSISLNTTLGTRQ